MVVFWCVCVCVVDLTTNIIILNFFFDEPWQEMGGHGKNSACNLLRILPRYDPQVYYCSQWKLTFLLLSCPQVMVDVQFSEGLKLPRANRIDQNL